MKETLYELTILDNDYRQLHAHLHGTSPVENAAYMLCGRSEYPGRVKLLVKEVVPLSPQDFRIQTDRRLQISPEAVAFVMKRARVNEQCIVLAHSHPLCDEEVDFSSVDDQGDFESFSNFYQRVPQGPHASVVFGRRAVKGRIWLSDLTTVPLSSITVVGPVLRKISTSGLVPTCANDHHQTHDRQVRAFGADGQKQIAQTTVAIVGAGGTGSAVADQMIRLGVQRLTIIDDDSVETSNTSRVYNSTMEDAALRTPKVTVVERVAEAVGFCTDVRAIKGNIIDEEVALELRQADVIFCCTDNHWSRAILNQYAYQYLAPVVDLGNKIDSNNERITAANGRVYTITPDGVCLWCCGVLDGKRVAEESLPQAERENLTREGYVTGTDTAAPSVIFLNTVIAGLAVGEFVNLVTGYMGRKYHPQLTYYALTGEVKPTLYDAASACDCATGKHRALGDRVRLPCR